MGRRESSWRESIEKNVDNFRSRCSIIAWGVSQYPTGSSRLRGAAAADDVTDRFVTDLELEPMALSQLEQTPSVGYVVVLYVQA
jgi:hypothetical protein